jgi:hypothetical protein
VTKSKRTRCVRHVARVREKRNIYRTFLGKYEGRGYCEELGVDRRTILILVSRKVV